MSDWEALFLANVTTSTPSHSQNEATPSVVMLNRDCQYRNQSEAAAMAVRQPCIIQSCHTLSHTIIDLPIILNHLQMDSSAFQHFATKVLKIRT